MGGRVGKEGGEREEVGGREGGRERRSTHEIDGATGEEALVSGVELLLTSKIPAVDLVGLAINHIATCTCTYTCILYASYMHCIYTNTCNTSINPNLYMKDGTCFYGLAYVYICMYI